MSKNELDVKIGAAWQAHYNGQHAAAVEQFNQIVADNPDHIDANWGLGLSARKAGDSETALQAFTKARDLIVAELASDPEDYERFIMLERMVKQQVEQMSDFI